MPQSLARILVHGVFSTKHRMPLLKDAQIRHELHAYFPETLQLLECLPSAVDGVEDHIHFLCPPLAKVQGDGPDRGDEDRQFKMDQNQGTRLSRILLAGWLRCVFATFAAWWNINRW